VSVDLLLDSVRPTSVKALLPKIAAVFTELLCLTSVPALVIQRLEGGERLPIVADQVGIDNAPFILISIAGEPETVGLVGRADHLTVTIFGPRSSHQYALAAAIAIAFSRRPDFDDLIAPLVRAVGPDGELPDGFGRRIAAAASSPKGPKVRFGARSCATSRRLLLKISPFSTHCARLKARNFAKAHNVDSGTQRFRAAPRPPRRDPKTNSFGAGL